MPVTGAIGRRGGFHQGRGDSPGHGVAVLADSELYRTGSVKLLVIQYGKAPKGMRKWSGINERV